MILGRQAVFIVIAWKQEESSNRQWDITVGAKFGLSESQFSSLEEHINTGTDSSILLVISFAKIFECEAADNHDKSDWNYMYDKYTSKWIKRFTLNHTSLDLNYVKICLDLLQL